ncbi:MAG: hypothetical protein V8S96_05795 [Lachnospiraceae bacterium]
MSTPTAPSVTALCLLKPFSIVGASAKAEMTAESTTARMNASVSVPSNAYFYVLFLGSLRIADPRLSYRDGMVLGWQRP